MRVPIAPPAGLVSDETTFASPGAWADGNNVRFWRGKAQVIGGWTSASDSTLTGVCRSVLSWIDNDGESVIAFGTHSSLQVLKSGQLYDISPTGLFPGNIDSAGGPGFGVGGYGEGPYSGGLTTEWWARTWSLSNWGEGLIANPRGKRIYYWDNNTANDAVLIANAPELVTFAMVTPERQVLAFGCNEELSNVFNPMCIRGSDIGDYDDWTTSPSNNAFEHILEGSGRIVGAAMLGAYVAVWTDTSCYLGQFIGSGGQAYRFDLVAENCGLLGPNAVTVINGTAYWMTPDLTPYQWSLGSPPSPVNCPIRDEMVANFEIGQAEKAVACSNGRFGEVWFFYPDSRDGLENSRYIASSVYDGAWFRGELARTAATDAGPTAYPLWVDYAGNCYWHESGTSANGGEISWYIESSAQYIDEAQGRVLIRGIWPDFENQQGTVSLTVKYRAYPQAVERSKGPYALSAGVSKRDFLADGRIAALRFSGSSAPAFVRFGKPSFDVVATGAK